jgi:drug/metabolite transporter (DMT)-like permease
MSRTAIILAATTVAIWSTLAFLGSQLNDLPPFLLVGIALCIGGLIGLPRLREWRVPAKTLFVGIGGIFGYHFLLFTAFQHAPAVEANLLNYLWPLLIVLLSPLFLAGYQLHAYHLAGAISGLIGAGLIVTGGRLSLDLANLTGYLLAAGAAFVWAAYSLMIKRLPPFSTAAVAAFCLCSGLLSLGFYVLFPGQLTPQVSGREWIFLLLLGAGPMGIAFFTKDVMKLLWDVDHNLHPASARYHHP